MIRYIFILILFIPQVVLASGPIFLGMAAGNSGGDGTPYTNPLEPKNYGTGWSEISCTTNCAENGNCDLWSSPCPMFQMYSDNCSELFNYCQRSDEEGPNYCLPGNCLGAGGVLRGYYHINDWGSETGFPLFKEQSGGAWNLYPLWINLSGTNIGPAQQICGTTGIPAPLEWWWPYYNEIALIQVYWWAGLYDTTWQQAYTAGTTFTQWLLGSGGWTDFMDEDFKDEFISRCEAMPWKLTADYSAESCSCTLGYPGSMDTASNVTVMLDTFGDDYGWSDYDNLDGYSYVSNSKLILEAHNATPALNLGFARRDRIGQSGSTPSDIMYITYLLKHDELGEITNYGGASNNNYFWVSTTAGTTQQFSIFHATNGVFVYNSGTQEVGTDINKVCDSGTSVKGCWQEWTFRVGITGGAEQSAMTFDAWLNDVQVADDVSWNMGACCNPGNVAFWQFGQEIDTKTEIEFVTFGNDFY